MSSVQASGEERPTDARIPSAIVENGTIEPIRSDRQPVLLYVVNVAWFFCLHRLHLARAARAAGFTVHVATGPDFIEHVERIRTEGLVFHELKLRRGRWSVLEECGLAGSLYKLYREIRPDIVHHVTIKPVLCGTLAARLASVPAVINSISGLGFVFTAADKWATLRRLAVELSYKVLFARAAIRVIFENSDDLQMFVDRRIIKSHQAVLIRGVGVDLERFRPSAPRTGVPLVVLPARMLWDKGVREFCEAAATVQGWGLHARFALVGGLDTGNPAAIPESWLSEQQRSGVIEWWGWREDMVAVYAVAHIVCLPSYREGLPTVLLEAGACGCALVTTDVPGCREVVRDGDTGLVVPSRDSMALAQALRTVILDSALRERLSVAACARVAAEFSAERMRSSTTRLYRGLLGSP
jgi:glycosyltransferase involved in cell wall biosynthesis